MKLKYIWNRFLSEYNYFHRKTIVNNEPEVNGVNEFIPNTIVI